MNYSKIGIERKQHYIKSTTRRLVSKTRISFFRIFLVFAVFIAIVGSIGAYGFIKGIIDSAPNLDDINVIPTGYKTTINDKEGNTIEQLVGAQSNRVYVTIDKIPKIVQEAFISIEDERFYEHDGIDVRGTLRAAFTGLSHGGAFSQGGSTITQQLLKNQVFNGGQEKEFMDRLKRKIQEQYLAVQLENKIDKDTILEYYLNTINLGSGTYGVQTASRRYFNKDVSELNLSEAAVIAAIAQLPVYRNPITYPKKNAERRSEILDEMLKQGYCTPDEYAEAVADDVYSRIQSTNAAVDSTSYYSYFVDELIEQVLNDLQTKLGYTQSQATNLLYTGGLTIYTTQDPTIQKICDDAYSDEKNFPEMGDSLWELTYALSVQKKDGTTIHYHGNDLVDYYKDFDDPDDLYVDDNSSKFSLLFKDKEDMQKKIDVFRKAKVEPGDIILGEKTTMTIQPQSSFVVMDQHTGYVKALIGGRGDKSGNRIWNRATDTTRQPGSTFKVLSTYLPAFDTSTFTLASVQDDAPFKYPGTDKQVSNWTNTNRFEGLSTLRKAIWNSMNIVTVKTLEQVTPQVGYDYLLKLGFTSLVESRTESDGRVVSDINLPMALGGLTDGVSNLELTAAYAAIANGGIYTQPVFYTKILDHNGKVLLENKPKKEQVMKESTAWLLTSAMQDVVEIGTGKLCKFTSIDMPVAGKTGSTSDYNDLWFTGYTPYYTATIWSGFDNNRTQTDKTYQKKLWRNIMEKIHIDLNLETQTFAMPDSIETAKICIKSGKLAVDGVCDKALDGNDIRVEYFAKGTVPTEKCDVHVKVNVCSVSGDLANEYCPKNLVKEAVYMNKEETSRTDDTPYVLPIGKKETCKIHGPGTAPAIETPPVDDDLYEDDDYLPIPPDDILQPPTDDENNLPPVNPDVNANDNGDSGNIGDTGDIDSTNP